VWLVALSAFALLLVRVGMALGSLELKLELVCPIAHRLATVCKLGPDVTSLAQNAMDACAARLTHIGHQTQAIPAFSLSNMAALRFAAPLFARAVAPAAHARVAVASMSTVTAPPSFVAPSGTCTKAHRHTANCCPTESQKVSLPNLFRLHPQMCSLAAV
jgi:hypothetical protein